MSLLCHAHDWICCSNEACEISIVFMCLPILVGQMHMTLEDYICSCGLHTSGTNTSKSIIRAKCIFQD